MTGAPDVVLRPDPATFRMLPWSDGTGWMTGDMEFPAGGPVPYAPRTVLRSALDQAAAAGCEAVIGIEVEFHLTRVDPAGARRTTGEMGAPGTATAVLPIGSGYQHQSETDLDEVDAFIHVLQDALEGLGLPLRTMESELGPSQLEFTFEPLPALEAADAAFLFRTAAKQIAKRHGFHVTFMSRPGLPGFFSSGWHLHLSMVDSVTRRNLFAPGPGEPLLSEFGRHFTAGLLAHARESALLTTPTVTGYKRFRANSLAPDRVNWGRDQRGAMIRVSGGAGDPNTHLENRVGESAANPYLYTASQILSGLDGVRRGHEPPAPTDAPYATEAPRLPRTLVEAVEAFDTSAFYRTAIGDEFVDFLVAHKRSEAARYQASELSHVTDPDAVSEWEQREYFDIH
jgi:glutamine synthetase